MDLAPGNWLLSPDGELIYKWHTLADGESFADHADTVDRIIRTDADKHAHLLRACFTGDDEATGYLLVASNRVTPDGYIIMHIVPPPGVSY